METQPPRASIDARAEHGFPHRISESEKLEWSAALPGGPPRTTSTLLASARPGKPLNRLTSASSCARRSAGLEAAIVAFMAFRSSALDDVTCSLGLTFRDHRSAAFPRKQECPCLSSRSREGTGKTNLHRNAGEVLLRTRSLGGNLRHTRKQVPRSRYRFPTGNTLVRQKDHLVSNMAEAASG